MAQIISSVRMITADAAKAQRIEQNRQAVEGVGAGFGFSMRNSIGGGALRNIQDRSGRYAIYDKMDFGDVARAMDIVAEHMCRKDELTNSPLRIVSMMGGNENLDPRLMTLLMSSLRVFMERNNLHTDLFKICRTLVKYGDCIFVDYDGVTGIVQRSGDGLLKRSDATTSEWVPIPMRNVREVVYSNEGNPVALKIDFTGTKLAASGTVSSSDVLIEQVVHFSLKQQLSDAFFGDSCLDPVYPDFFKLMMLENSALIYRMTRAPERLLYYVDIGGLPATRVKDYMAAAKQSMSQASQPTLATAFKSGEGVDTVYNPLSVSSEIFIPVKGGNAAGSRIEQLPAAQWEVPEVSYFLKKVIRALRVPVSYFAGAVDETSATNDGKVGTMLQEEGQFALFVERIQDYVNKELDRQFKQFLTDTQIVSKMGGLSEDVLDTFGVRLLPPSNYAKYVEVALMADALSNYNSVKDTQVLSERFKLKKFMLLTDEEIVANEMMIAEERGLQYVPGDMSMIRKLYDPKFDISKQPSIDRTGSVQAE
jgi:hypothetical protein